MWPLLSFVAAFMGNCFIVIDYCSERCQLKTQRESTCAHRAKAKTKAWKTKEADLKGIHSHKKKICTSSTFQNPNTMRCQRQLKSPLSVPMRNKVDYYAIIKVCLNTVSAMKKIEDNNILIFTVDVKANKHHVKQAVKKLYETYVAKVNTLLRLGKQKNEYVQLTPDYDSLDIANKIEII
ncbi:large ribosomal subunit protein uL23-like [Peromyscus eremicus]|uniref:large ribosomal subunit protein uL23-like n=1 Tax=Peromyscus eremicus TaxID=42410 RepID=UPI0027DB3F67|nr:large ribosomal subunit protein uL23-like [Peromyscus eremicus]